MKEYDSSDFESDSKDLNDFLKNDDFKEGFEKFSYSQLF